MKGKTLEGILDRLMPGVKVTVGGEEEEITGREDSSEVSIIDTLEEFRLANTQFQSIPESARECYNEMIQELGGLKFEDIHAVFMTVLVKSPAGEYCEGCKTVHESDGIKQLVTVIGMNGDLELAASVGLRRGTEKSVRNGSGGSITKGSVVYGPNKGGDEEEQKIKH